MTETNVDEIAEGIYRISALVPDAAPGGPPGLRAVREPQVADPGRPQRQMADSPPSEPRTR
jgi:hypothetical protein